MLIALDGPDGAGKSSLIARTVEWAQLEKISIRVVGKWDIFDGGLVPSARFLKGTTRDEFRVCIAEMPSPARMMMLAWMNTLAAERAAKATESIVILDGYWIKHAASELALGCPAGLVTAVTEAINEVDAVVYVDIDADEALRRKGNDITPYECGLDSSSRPAFFRSHQRKIRETMIGWAAQKGWWVINPGGPEAMSNQLVDIIRSTAAELRRPKG